MDYKKTDKCVALYELKGLGICVELKTLGILVETTIGFVWDEGIWYVDITICFVWDEGIRYVNDVSWRVVLICIVLGDNDDDGEDVFVEFKNTDEFIPVALVLSAIELCWLGTRVE